MSTAVADDLAAKCHLLEELHARLIHIHWNQESLAFVARAAEELSTLATEPLTRALSGQLAALINAELRAKRLPQGRQRHQLLALIDEILTLDPSADEERDTPEAAPEGLVMVVGNEVVDLPAHLEAAGFAVQIHHGLDGALKALLDTAPVAVILDLDALGHDAAREAGLNALEQRLGQRAALLLLGERTDLGERLQALSLGCAYHAKPLAAKPLVERLLCDLLPPVGRYYRVLIAMARNTEASHISHLLESRGINTQVLAQPRRLLEAMARFRPHLVVVDAALNDPPGSALVQVLRQHENYHQLPTLLLGEPERLAQLVKEGEDLELDWLPKPVDDALLPAAIFHRLRRARAAGHSLWAAAERDAVTDLYHRAAFLGHLRRQLAARDSEQRALLLVDLDSLGTSDVADLVSADALVAQAALRCRRLLGPHFPLARLDDNHLAALVTAADDVELRRLCLDVRATLVGEPVESGDSMLRLETFVGAVWLRRVTSPTELLQRATDACRRARHMGVEHVHLFDPAVEGDDNERLQELFDEVRQAVANQQLSLAYQAMVSLEGDRRTEYHEVLLRVHNRRGRALPPNVVFALAEHHGLGVILDRWVAVRALELLRRRQTAGTLPVLFVNLSALSLADGKFAVWLRRGLDKTGVEGRWLVIEVSATIASANPRALARTAQTLRGAGVRLAIDRFTPEILTPEQLRALKVDFVKLDAAYAGGLADDAGPRERLRRVVEQLGEALPQVPVVLTGVESLATLYSAWSCGVRYAQGFGLQRPRSDMRYDFTRWVPPPEEGAP